MRKLFFHTVPVVLVGLLVSSQAVASLPACKLAGSDSDGDGFGWENNASCRVTTSTRPQCSDNNSDPDGDGYGWENNQTCLVKTGEKPPPTDYPTCEQQRSDPDGDGYGWENNRTCRVGTVDKYPVCENANSDPDGDGFGWENNRTCLIEKTSAITALAPTGLISTGTPTFQWTAINADLYRIVVSDSSGNGYTSEVDPISAGCQTGTGVCEHTPALAYFDNHLSWVVQPVIDGDNGTLSNRLSITTPFSADIQPILSNEGSCEAWASVAYDNFVVLNNSWNSRTMNRTDWTQKISVSEDINGVIKPTWHYDWLGRYDGGEIEVKAYPEVLYGSKLGTHVSGTKAETGLPETVKNLPEFTVRYTYSETGTAERNVALESFFHDSCDIAGPCDDIDNRSYEMMIWVNNPTIRTPGKLALTGVSIDNQLWNVYIKPDSNKHYIAFTAQTPSTTGVLHWNRFVEWTQNWTRDNSESLGINILSEDFCMGAIELGTELWWGKGSFTLDEFEITYD